MSEFTEDRMGELRQLFFESAEEIVQTMNEQALLLESNPADEEAIRSLRRAVHTLKGDSAACGYTEISELSHTLEDTLALDGSASDAIVEAALAAADVFSEMLQAYRTGSGKTPAATTSLRKLLKRCQEPTAPNREKKKVARKKVSSAPVAPLAWNDDEQNAIEHARKSGHAVLDLGLDLDPACAMPEAALAMIRRALADTGEVLAIEPQDASQLAARPIVRAAVATDLGAQAVTNKCRIPGVVARVAAQILPAHAEPAPASSTIDATSKSIIEDASANASLAGENVLRVDAGRIDNVLNLVGELIIGRSMLQQTLLEVAARLPKDPVRKNLTEAIAFQSRVLNDLQRNVMKIRMVPVEHLFRRFPRLVRDVSKQCGKDVQLAVSGQTTDLDKSILDALAEPLAHLTRNAISHGLESAADRKAAGKPETGTIRLAASHQGNQMVIEVEDDGRGINIKKVREQAIAQGLTTSDEADRMSETEILQFIFRPGFSTAEEVTSISGRGVGLDVVENTMQRLKGSVGIETHPGRGTIFRLRLPLTLAIIRAILFRVAQRLYAVPLNAVVEMARAHEADIHRIDGHEVLHLREQVLPLVRLGHPPAGEIAGRNAAFLVLIVMQGEKKLGLVVDQVAAQEELVIKSIDTHIVSSDLISGASILGDGRVVLILNLAAVVDRMSHSRPDAGEISWGFLLPAAELRSMDEARSIPPSEVQ